MFKASEPILVKHSKLDLHVE